MPDMLQNGLAWLADKRHAHMSHEVTYRRGVLPTVTLNATVGKTDFESVSDTGATIQSQSRDYIVRAEDLVLGGVPVLPKAGDRIEECLAGVTQAYEVISPGGVPVYEWADPSHKDLRIHTKWTGTV